MNENTMDFNNLNENKQTKEINGKPLYYTTSQVAQILDETDSRIRHWSIKFSDVLNVETSGSHRRFSEENINQLRYIKELLQVQKLSIKQAIDFLKEKETNIIEKRISENDPIAVKAMATAISMSVKNVLEEVLHDFEVRQERKTEDDFESFETIIKEVQSQEFDRIQERLKFSIESKMNIVEESLKQIDSNISNNDIEDKIIEEQSKIYNEVELLKQQLEAQNKIIEQQNKILKEKSEQDDKINKQAEERDRQLMEITKKLLEDKREKEEQQVEKKGIFKRFFGN